MDDLAQFLRPAGGGIHTVSTGRAARESLQKALYGASDDAEVQAKWRAALASIGRARVAILGIPSDCGAGLTRGAAFGPEAVRSALLRQAPDFPARALRAGIVDVGDRLRRAAAPDRRHAERRATTPDTRGALRPVRRKRRLAGGAADDCRTRRRSIAAGASRIANLHAGGRSLGGLAGGGGDRAARLRAVGDRSRGRAHGSVARASRHPDLLRHLGLPRQRARGPGRTAGAGRRADVVAHEGTLGVDARRPAVLGRRGSRARRRGDRRRDPASARAGRPARLSVERHRRHRQRGRPFDRRARAERPARPTSCGC